MGIIKDFLKKIFGNRYIVKCKNFKLDCENNGTDVIKNEKTSTASEKIKKYKKLSPSEKVEYDKNELFISYKEDKKLEEIIPYSYNEKYGYLTTCPTNLVYLL